MKINLSRASAIACIALGSLIINTFPVWLAELASIHSLDVGEAGSLATAILLTSGMACIVHSITAYPILDRIFALIAAVLALVIGFSTSFVSGHIHLIGALFGWAVGTIFAYGIESSFNRSDPLRTISPALSAGLVLSLLAIVAHTSIQVKIMWLIAALIFGTACILAVSQLSGQDRSHVSALPVFTLHWSDFLYLPFFTSMGAFWAFIEVYGVSVSVPHVKSLLVASLIVSALGSTTSILFDRTRHDRWIFLSVIGSTVSGALLYVSGSLIAFSFLLFANSFFLFVFLPLYISARHTLRKSSDPQIKAALYLLGLAIGGIAGGHIIQSYGYTAFAVAVAFSAIPACAAVWLQFRTPIQPH